MDTISQQTVRHTHFKLNWAFKVIQGHPAGIQNGVLS